MKPYDHDPDPDYIDILRFLEPRHAPRTSMRFSPPDALPPRRSPMRDMAKQVIRVAALLIVGIGISLLMIRPDNTQAATKAVELGVSQLIASQECRIEFSARLLPPTPRRLFHISPSGKMHAATLVYRSDHPQQMLTLDWSDASGAHSLVSDSDGNVTFDGSLRGREFSNTDISTLRDVLYKGSLALAGLNDRSCNIAMTRNGDDITVDLKGKNAHFVLHLSDDTGRILSIKAYDESEDHLLMFETKSISYL